MARPVSRQRWIKFYPDEFESDAAVRVCSLAAQGLWIRMICLMHRGAPTGHLTVSARPVKADMLAQIVGFPAAEVSALLAELRLNGVFSETSGGVIFSRRMVADAKAYAEHVKNGRCGGNPAITKKKSAESERQAVNPLVYPVDNLPNNRGHNAGLILEIERESERESEFLSSHPAPPTKARSDRGTRLPTDWQPSEADRQYAESLGVDPLRTAENFRGYWLAKAGKDARKVNWSLTWKTWCRNESDRRGNRQGLAPALAGGKVDVRRLMGSCN